LLALSIYRTLSAKVAQIIFSGLDIIFNEDTQWANNFYWRIIRLVANPESIIPMNFERIVKFLDIRISPPINLPHDEKELAIAVQENCIKFYQENPDIDRDHLFRILSSFIRLYKHEKHTVEPLKMFSFPLHKLPSIPLGIMDLYNLDIDYVHATFDCIERKLLFSSVVSHQVLFNGLNNLLASLTPQNATENNLKIAHMLNFIMQIYHAYCKININQLHLDMEYGNKYIDFMMFHDMPAEFITKNLEHIDKIVKHLAEDQFAKSIFTRLAPETVAAQKQHSTLLKSRLPEIYSDLFAGTQLDALICDLESDIKNNTFNKNYITIDPYHTFIVSVCNNLKDLKKWQHKEKDNYIFIPESIKDNKQKQENRNEESNLVRLGLWTRKSDQTVSNTPVSDEKSTYQSHKI
jgi:hypothetical protein